MSFPEKLLKYIKKYKILQKLNENVEELHPWISSYHNKISSQRPKPKKKRKD